VGDEKTIVPEMGGDVISAIADFFIGVIVR
jgi:hypothetical protein